MSSITIENIEVTDASENNVTVTVSLADDSYRWYYELGDIESEIQPEGTHFVTFSAGPGQHTVTVYALDDHMQPPLEDMDSQSFEVVEQTWWSEDDQQLNAGDVHDIKLWHDKAIFVPELSASVPEPNSPTKYVFTYTGDSTEGSTEYATIKFADHTLEAGKTGGFEYATEIRISSSSNRLIVEHPYRQSDGKIKSSPTQLHLPSAEHGTDGDTLNLEIASYNVKITIDDVAEYKTHDDDRTYTCTGYVNEAGEDYDWNTYEYDCSTCPRPIARDPLGHCWDPWRHYNVHLRFSLEIVALTPSVSGFTYREGTPLDGNTNIGGRTAEKIRWTGFDGNYTRVSQDELEWENKVYAPTITDKMGTVFQMQDNRGIYYRLFWNKIREYWELAYSIWYDPIGQTYVDKHSTIGWTSAFWAETSWGWKHSFPEYAWKWAPPHSYLTTRFIDHPTKANDFLLWQWDAPVVAKRPITRVDLDDDGHWQIEGLISRHDPWNQWYYPVDDYVLRGDIENLVGRRIMVSLVSDDFDASLEIINSNEFYWAATGNPDSHINGPTRRMDHENEVWEANVTSAAGYSAKGHTNVEYIIDWSEYAWDAVIRVVSENLKYRGQSYTGKYTLKFDVIDICEGCDVTISDNSTSEHIAKLGPRYSPPEHVDGKFGKALKFDGVKDIVTTEVTEDLKFKKEMTVSTWVNISSDSKNVPYMQLFQPFDWFGYRPYTDPDWSKVAIVGNWVSRISVHNSWQLYLMHDASGSNEELPRLAFEVTADGYAHKWHSEYKDAYMTEGLAYDTWYHVAATFRGDKFIRLYVNGERKKTLSIDIPHIYVHEGEVPVRNPNVSAEVDSGTTFPSQELRVGNQLAGNLPGFLGSVDDLRLYKRALNDLQIKAIYGDGLGDSKKHLISSGKLELETMIEENTEFEPLPEPTPPTYYSYLIRSDCRLQDVLYEKIKTTTQLQFGLTYRISLSGTDRCIFDFVEIDYEESHELVEISNESYDDKLRTSCGECYDTYGEQYDSDPYGGILESITSHKIVRKFLNASLSGCAGELTTDLYVMTGYFDPDLTYKIDMGTTYQCISGGNSVGAGHELYDYVDGMDVLDIVSTHNNCEECRVDMTHPSTPGQPSVSLTLSSNFNEAHRSGGYSVNTGDDVGWVTLTYDNIPDEAYSEIFLDGDMQYWEVSVTSATDGWMTPDEFEEEEYGFDSLTSGTKFYFRMNGKQRRTYKQAPYLFNMHVMVDFAGAVLETDINFQGTVAQGCFPPGKHDVRSEGGSHRTWSIETNGAFGSRPELELGVGCEYHFVNVGNKTFKFMIGDQIEGGDVLGQYYGNSVKWTPTEIGTYYYWSDKLTGMGNVIYVDPDCDCTDPDAFPADE